MLRLPCVFLAGLAACYSPRVTPGVACVDACPGDQVCIDGACRDPGYTADAAIDMPIDGSPDVDTDGDGAFDDEDNCAMIGNVDQHDEDGDDLGDVCDPCPHVAIGGAMDMDADGVGDACDPEPAIDKQRLRVFDPFTSRSPAWTMSTAATFGVDAMTIEDGFIRHTITLSDFRVQIGGELAVTTGSQQMVLEVSHVAGANYYYGEFFGDEIEGFMKITRRADTMYGTVAGTGYTGSIPAGPFEWSLDVSVANQTLAFDTRHAATDFPVLAGSAIAAQPLTATTYVQIGTNENIVARLDYFVLIETIP